MRKILKLTTGALALGVLAGVVGAAKPAQAATGGVGWQAPYTYTVPTGLGDLFFHYDCPAGFSVQNGGFQTTSTTQGNGFLLSGNGPRLDISPANYNEYAWNFRWEAGGAPAGSLITFNVLCKKGAP